MNQVVLTEIWRDISGYEGLYQVSNLGRVKSFVGWNGHEYIPRERIITGALSDENRIVLNLAKDGKKKTVKLHRLVAEAFIPNPYGYDVINHVDSNPSNNDISNLEWCTQKQNMIHAHRFGNMKRKAFKCPRIKKPKLSKYGIRVDILKHQISNGATNRELSELYGCPSSYIARRRYQIKRGEI